MNIILVDTNAKQFLPLTYTRPVSDLRVGILTIKEKWERHLGQKVHQRTESFLQNLYPIEASEDNVFINSKFLPNEQLVEQIEGLQMNQKLIHSSDWVACRIQSKEFEISSSMPAIPAFTGEQIENWWDILAINGSEIKLDFASFYPESAQIISDSNQVIGNRKLLNIHPKSVVEGVTFNTQYGPIFIDQDVVIQEGSFIRGPFAALKGAVIKMGAKIYEGTTVGPQCLVGGEVKNVIFLSHSNKAHDGYLGNSILGAGVNIGAGTSCSNLKNAAGTIKAWNFTDKSLKDSGQVKLGCIIGDHSKIAINSSINSGCTIGVSCNVFGTGLLPKWIPNFSWGTTDQIKFDLEKAIDSYVKWTELAGRKSSQNTIETLKYLAKRRE